MPYICAIDHAERFAMTRAAIKQAAEICGSQSRLAALIGVKPPTVHQWATGDRPVPAGRCIDIETATNGAVTRQHLRPDDWHRIWPELAEQKAA